MPALSDILFSNPLALLALASVIPLIILYMLRPRTIDVTVPSLLFFLRREQERNRFTLLIRKLIRDPLFLIQLLILILLSLAMAGPYILEEQLSGQHTVIVIDNSASMEAGSRLDEAKALASQRLSAINSIIWAQNVPVLSLKEGDSTRAEEVIALTPQRATSSDLAAAISYGQRLAPGGTIIVFSDFASWIGDDPLVAKGLAENSGVRVEFVQVGQRGGNIGITSGWLDSGRNLNLAVKNFNDADERVTFNIRTGGIERRGNLQIPARSTRAYVVQDLGTGSTEISMDNGGSLSIDDMAYVYIPAAAGGRILLVDTRDRSPAGIALGLVRPDLEHSKTLPTDLSAYGIAILGNVDNETYGDDSLTGFVERGGVLIISATEGLMGGDLLPIEPAGISDETDITGIPDSPLITGIPVKDVEVIRYIRGSARPNTTVVLSVADGSPLLAYRNRGQGTVIYLGLNDLTGDDAWSGFATMPEYPLFWKNVLNWLGGADVDQYNVKTGTNIRLPSKQTIGYPDGSTMTTSSLWIDQTGIYSIGEKKLAANLYDASESDVDNIVLDASSIPSRYTRRPEFVTTETKEDLSPYLILLVLGLIAAELIYLYRRRELF